MSRREKQRKELIAEIKSTAKVLMAENGTAGLSIRAIAKRIEITPPAIHYYFKTVDDLITTLLIDEFNALVKYLKETAEENSGFPFSIQFYRYAHALRGWALANSTEFQLIYGNPIPGYVQPIEQTYPPAREGFALFAGMVSQAIEAKELSLPYQYLAAAERLSQPLSELQQEAGHQHDPAVLYMTASLWSRLHGLITLELYNLIQPVVGDIALFFHLEVIRTLTEIGVTNIEMVEKN